MAIILDGTTGITAPDITSAAGLDAADLTGTVASARLPAGSVIQVVSTTKTDVFSSTATSYTDITGMSLSITPISASSKILFLASMTIGSAPTNIIMTFRVVRGATVINVGDARSGFGQATIGGARGVYDTNGTNTVPLLFLDSPNTTASTTYKIQGFGEGGTFKINTAGADASGSVWSYTSASTITLMEIAG